MDGSLMEARQKRAKGHCLGCYRRAKKRGRNGLAIEGFRVANKLLLGSMRAKDAGRSARSRKLRLGYPYLMGVILIVFVLVRSITRTVRMHMTMRGLGYFRTRAASLLIHKGAFRNAKPGARTFNGAKEQVAAHGANHETQAHDEGA